MAFSSVFGVVWVKNAKENLLYWFKAGSSFTRATYYCKIFLTMGDIWSIIKLRNCIKAISKEGSMKKKTLLVVCCQYVLQF